MPFKAPDEREVMLKIIVPIKQVPETGNVRMDPETGTMVRDGVVSIVNPLDLYSIETALMLKEKYGAVVTVLTMGPLNAVKALKEAIAMGCDEGYILSDRAFAGADTWATAYALMSAIQRLGDFDLVLAGERATDGDTGQVGPNIAAGLDLPLATYVRKVKHLDPEGRTITVERSVEEGIETLQLPLPCLLTVVKEISYPRLPTLRGKKRAKTAEIPVFSADDLGLKKEFLGLKGSPTRVVSTTSPKVTRNGQMVRIKEDEDVSSAVEALVNFLEERKLI